MPSHRLIHPSLPKSPGVKAAPKKGAAGVPQWPSYNGTSKLVGVSRSGVTVYVDPLLGAPGMQNATDLLADADRVRVMNDGTFGVKGGPVDVIVFALGGVTDGTGGADHMGCDYTTGGQIEVCASFGNSMRCSALFEAELSECSMNGQLCGLSTGEALSRWCAMEVSGNALADFATGPIWAQDGMANWVDAVDPTDGNPDSTGCGMVFISWLMGPAYGMTLLQVAEAMVKDGDAGTLSMLCPVPSTAWKDFQAAIAAIPGGVTSDDPFNALGGAPVPAPTPEPTPTPTPEPPPTPAPEPTPAPPTSTTTTLQLALMVMGECLMALCSEDAEVALKAAIQDILDAN